jgi:hypothetical protein
MCHVNKSLLHKTDFFEETVKATCGVFFYKYYPDTIQLQRPNIPKEKQRPFEDNSVKSLFNINHDICNVLVFTNNIVCREVNDTSKDQVLYKKRKR